MDKRKPSAVHLKGGCLALDAWNVFLGDGGGGGGRWGSVGVVVAPQGRRDDAFGVQYTTTKLFILKGALATTLVLFAVYKDEVAIS